MLSSHPTKKTFNKIKDSFRLFQRPVFYVRFSHGEFKALRNKNDGVYTEASPELRDELIEALLIDDPNYLIALNDVHPKERHMSPSIFHNGKYRAQTSNFFSILLKTLGRKKSTFENSICFHYYAAYKMKEFIEFFDVCIKRRRKMFIGSLPQKSCEKLLGPIDIYVETPELQAYNTIDEWWPLIEEGRTQVDTILMACGPCAAVVGKRLWELGYRNSFLTLGGSIDAAVGHTTGSRNREWINCSKERIDELQKYVEGREAD